MSHTITLNGNIIEAIRKNINYPSHERSKYERERLRFSHCLFLTQDKNILTYQIATPYNIVRISEPTDIKIPYPLAINLELVYIKNSPSINLEIPDCTFATLQTFNNTDRPKYIKTNDLKTNVVMLGNYKTNLEYLNDMQKKTNYMNYLINCKIDYDTKDNAKQYDWDKEYLCDLADTLHLEYPKPSYIKYLLSQQTELDKYADKYAMPKILQQVSKFGYLYRTEYGKDCAEKTLKIPVAIFEKNIGVQQMIGLIIGRTTQIEHTK